MTSATSLPTCYRHPDRETRLACSSCLRPVCVDCVQPVPVGQLCPECAAQRRAPAVAGQAGSPVTYGLLATAVAVFLVGMVSPELRRTLILFGGQINGAVAQGEWWRLLTAAFLHADLMHVLFNMWALYVFGPPLERRWGSASFAALYVASALAGGALFFHLGSPGGLAVGASGAIFGLFGAWLAASLRNRHTSAGRAGLQQLLVLLGVNAALPLVFPVIAWQAHLGGLAAGFFIALAWSSLRPAARTRRVLLAVAVATAALAAVIML